MLKLYSVILLIIFGGIVLHAPLSVGLGTLFPHYELLIKSWKELLMLALVPLAIILVLRRRLWRELLSDWIFRFVLVFAALHIVLALMTTSTVPAVAAGLAIDLRYILFFTLVYIALRLLPEWRQWFIRIGTIGAFIVVGFTVIQLFLPPDFLKIIGYGNDTIQPYLTVDKNPDYIRYSSTLRGPNPLGAYAGMVLAFLVAIWARSKAKTQNKRFLITVSLLTVCAVISLWVSYSRSSLVGGIVGVVLAGIVAVGWKLPKRSWIAAIAIVLALVGVLFAARGTDFVSNVILHENLQGGSSISSNDDHVTSLQTGTERLINQPFGAGIGSTGSASLYGEAPIIIENQYLFIAHEAGWLGLALFLTLFGLLLVRLWRWRDDWLALGVFASGIGLALIGLLLPVWADDTISIVWWGLAAVALTGESNGKTTKQKTKRTA
jgi:hypothetical protein